MNLNQGPKKYINPKHGREVCRQWLNGMCQKGDLCEFLHQIDPAKMPNCPQGSRCDRKESPLEPCPFVHPLKKTRCRNYDTGFCSFGNRCQHEHISQPGPPPEWSAYFFPLETREVSFNFKKAPCTQFSEHGWCPQFEMCNFVHHVESNK